MTPSSNPAALTPASPDILLIDATPSLRSIYESHLSDAGFDTISASTAGEAVSLFRQHGANLVLIDPMLPDGDGISVIISILEHDPATPILVVTADRSIERAVAAMRAGAHDFLIKPVSEARLMAAIEAARAKARPQPRIEALEPPGPTAEFIGNSPAMREVQERIRAAARSEAPVYITGESGTGKELCAQWVHRLSERASGPFITFDCSAIPAERLDSELFGHRRGAFPGAVSDRIGAAEMAEGGTLLLEGICEIDPALQTKLLRFLQSGMIQPLGAEQPRRMNLRILSASSIPPFEAVQTGQLREDLYYRLVVLPIHMPPLRQRREDIVPLALDILHRYAALEGRRFERFSAGAEAALIARNWPGNVRELMNVLRAAVVMHEGIELTEAMLPLDTSGGLMDLPLEGPERSFTPRSLAQIEREAIERALARHSGSVPRAARELDVAPSTLYRKLEGWRSP